MSLKLIVKLINADKAKMSRFLEGLELKSRKLMIGENQYTTASTT